MCTGKGLKVDMLVFLEEPAAVSTWRSPILLYYFAVVTFVVTQVVAIWAVRCVLKLLISTYFLRYILRFSMNCSPPNLSVRLPQGSVDITIMGPRAAKGVYLSLASPFTD